MCFRQKNCKKKAIDIRSVIQKIEDFNITIKPIQKQHLQTLTELPLYTNHTDPNDRLIIAQAISDKLPLISSDLKFALYTKNKLDFIKNKR
ncbi:MAG: PIN domain-containing protein [Paludibacteraceae bacterium]